MAKCGSYRTQFFSLDGALTLSQTNLGFYVFEIKKSFENTVAEGEIARNEQFLLLPLCFLPFWRTLLFSSNLKLSSANSFQFGRV